MRRVAPRSAIERLSLEGRLSAASRDLRATLVRREAGFLQHRRRITSLRVPGTNPIDGVAAPAALRSPSGDSSFEKVCGTIQGFFHRSAPRTVEKLIMHDGAGCRLDILGHKWLDAC